MSLKQWTNGALEAARKISTDINDESGIASTPYLTSALQIALSLAEQINKVEDNPEKLELLLVHGHQWGDCVRVQLEAPNSSESNKVLDADKTSSEDVSTSNENAAALDMNSRADAFLKSFAAGDYKASEAFARHSSEDIRWLSNERRWLSNERDKKLPSRPTADLSYLSVCDVYIQLPESLPHNTSTSGNSAENRTRAVYFLGLVFYELFSGGEKPPHSLLELSAFDGAFVSLPRLSLAEKREGINDFRVGAKRLQTTTEETSLCNLSFEYLRSIGLPSSICQLILDMLECIYGDLSDNDSFTSVSDVACDLQLMVSEPKFLRDFDTSALSSLGLSTHLFVIPRDEEYESIMSCYHRSITGSNEVVMIMENKASARRGLSRKLGCKLFVCQIRSTAVNAAFCSIGISI